MEVKIGVKDVAREVVLESELSASEVTAAVMAALKDGGMLALTSDKGRQVLIPAANIGYIEMGAEQARPVGFAGS